MPMWYTHLKANSLLAPNEPKDTGEKIKPVISVSVEVNSETKTTAHSIYSLFLVMAPVCLGVIGWLTFIWTGHSSTEYMFQMNCKQSLTHILQFANGE